MSRPKESTALACTHTPQQRCTHHRTNERTFGILTLGDLHQQTRRRMLHPQFAQDGRPIIGHHNPAVRIYARVKQGHMP